MQKKALAVILIQCILQYDLLLWQKLQPAQAEMRQLPHCPAGQRPRGMCSATKQQFSVISLF